MKIKNRKYHKQCYSEKTLREVSMGKIYMKDIKIEIKMDDSIRKNLEETKLILKVFSEEITKIIKNS